MAAATSPPPAAGRSHPTYKEMVVQALTELRDPGGSSRGAISKYIADHFAGLPACHDALLSAHLRRLRSQGLLRMSGCSYLLPTAPNPPPPLRGRGQKRGPGRPRKNAADLSPSPSPSPSPPFQGVKRGPGRPRKNTIPMSVPHAATTMPAAGKRGRGRPPKNAHILIGMPRSVTLFAIATSSSLLKRRAGRPPKVPFPAVPSLVAGTRKRGRPPKDKRPPGSPRSQLGLFGQSVALTRRGPGRPRKERRLGGGHLKVGVEAQPQAAAPNGGQVRHLPPSGASSTEKRGRGRPRKRLVETEATETGVAALVEKRGPGRPRKKNPSASLSVETEEFAASGYKRGRGRPRKERSSGSGHLKAGAEAQSRAADQADDVRNGGEVRHLPSNGASWSEKRGRGRPRKRPLQTETTEMGIAALVEKRGPGRPTKKNPSAPLSVETEEFAVSGYKRGRGRPRKEWSFGRRHLKAGVEAQPQAADQADDVQTGGEVRNLPSSGASSSEKRGRGRPRKRPLETETKETGVASLLEKRGPGRPRKNNLSAPLFVETEEFAMSGYKRGRGRPRKENPSAGISAETGIAAPMGNKRGRGRPRKNVSFPTESKEAAVGVSRDLAENKPKQDDTSVSGNKTETKSILSEESMEARPADAGGVLVSGEKVSTGHVQAEGTMLGVDPIVSNLDNRSL